MTNYRRLFTLSADAIAFLILSILNFFLFKIILGSFILRILSGIVLSLLVVISGHLTGKYLRRFGFVSRPMLIPLSLVVCILIVLGTCIYTSTLKHPPIADAIVTFYKINADSSQQDVTDMTDENGDSFIPPLILSDKLYKAKIRVMYNRFINVREGSLFEPKTYILTVFNISVIIIISSLEYISDRL